MAVDHVDFFRIDLRDEELRAALDVRPEQGLGAVGDLVLVVAQPGLEPRRVRRRQDQDLVLADVELRFDRDAPHRPVASAEPEPARCLTDCVTEQPTIDAVVLARVLFPVLDQARRTERVDPIEHVGGERLDVLLVEHRRHRNHHREALEWTLVVVLHRQHGACAVAHQHDLGRVVDHLAARGADVEPAERVRSARCGRDQERSHHDLTQRWHRLSDNRAGDRFAKNRLGVESGGSSWMVGRPKPSLRHRRSGLAASSSRRSGGINASRGRMARAR